MRAAGHKSSKKELESARAEDSLITLRGLAPKVGGHRFLVHHGLHSEQQSRSIVARKRHAVVSQLI
jgi:hypothetical protein